MPRFGRAQRTSNTQQAAYHPTAIQQPFTQQSVAREPVAQQPVAQRAFEEAMAQKAHDVDFVAFAQRQQELRFAVEARWHQQQKAYQNTRLLLKILGPLAIVVVILAGHSAMAPWPFTTVIALLVALVLATLWRSNEARNMTLANALAAAGITSERHSGFTGSSSSTPRRW